MFQGASTAGAAVGTLPHLGSWSVQSLCSAFTESWTYDPTERVCVPTTFRRTANPLDVAGLALCICAGSYVTSWMQHSPCSVQGRASRKVAVYLVNALRTYGPMFACYVDGKLFCNLTVLTTAWIFELLGGLFNTFTCAMQSRYAPALFGQSTLVRDNPTALQRHSFNVAFVDDVEAADTDAVNSWPSLLWQSNSFRVQWSTFTNIETPFAADLEVGNSRFLFLRQS